MARYHVSINTDGYTSLRCSKKNWEPGTINDFIHAINGWESTEKSLTEVRWRIELLLHQTHYHCGNAHWEKWFAKKKNKIRYQDQLCEMERIDDVSVPGFAQGYVNINDLLNELKQTGSVRIPFSMGYDMRQSGRSKKWPDLRPPLAFAGGGFLFDRHLIFAEILFPLYV